MTPGKEDGRHHNYIKFGFVRVMVANDDGIYGAVLWIGDRMRDRQINWAGLREVTIDKKAKSLMQLILNTSADGRRRLRDKLDRTERKKLSELKPPRGDY